MNEGILCNLMLIKSTVGLQLSNLVLGTGHDWISLEVPQSEPDQFTWILLGEFKDAKSN